MSKKFNELNLSNAFLFAAALQDPETCRLVLKLILGRDVGEVCVKAEHNILYSSDYRSVRLDIYATDAMKVTYDLDMQNKNEGNLPKRSRYYQGMMDLSSLKPGEDFNELQPSYVIFICAFDPFGYGLYQYTYRETCEETGEALEDEAVRIYLSTEGENDDQVPEELVHFLKYVKDSSEKCVEQTNNSDIRKLHEKVCTLKKDRDLEVGFMRFEELLNQERHEGEKAGHKSGQNQIITLISYLSADGLVNEIPRLSTDPDFLQEMLEKYDLNDGDSIR